MSLTIILVYVFQKKINVVSTNLRNSAMVNLAKYISEGDIFPLVIGFMCTYIFILWNALHANKMKKQNKLQLCGNSSKTQ